MEADLNESGPEWRAWVDSGEWVLEQGRFRIDYGAINYDIIGVS